MDTHEDKGTHYTLDDLEKVAMSIYLEAPDSAINIASEEE